MSYCGVSDCNHNNLRETCSFFKLPTEPGTRTKWLHLVRRDPENLPKIFRVCSCHFRGGKKENGPELLADGKVMKPQVEYLSPQRKTQKVKRKLFSEPLSSCFENQANILPSNESHAIGQGVDEEPAAEFSLVADINAPSTSKSSLLEAENYFLKRNVEKLQETVKKRLSYDSIKDNTKLIVLYTGLPDSKLFEVLYDLVGDLDIEYYFKYRVEKISKKDQLFLTLMKLRQNFPHEDLAFRFGVSSSTISNVVITWVHVLYEVLYKQLMSTIPSREKNKSCLPTSFSNFTNCRIILDCTDVLTMFPRKSMKNQKLTFSTYKHRNTLKALVGVAPNGVLTFLSDLYPGSISDKLIVEKSGIIDHLLPGDLVLADKGFLIRDIIPPDINLNVPPFLVTSQFTKEQVRLTETIARARIHVERAIRRIKSFKILNLIPSKLVSHADVIFKVVGALTNVKYPLIKEVEDLYYEVDEEILF